MSFDINVYFSSSKTPTDKVWQTAIAQIGAPILFKEPFVLNETEGWLPCSYDGVDSGFEIYVSSLSDADREELGLDSSCDSDATFCTAADDFSLASAVWAAATLANSTGGVLIDCQSGEEFRGEETLAWAQGVVEALAEEGEAGDSEEEPSFNEETRELINSAINSAFEIIAGGSALDPFVRSYESEEFHDYSLVADVLEEAIEKGVELVQSFPSTVLAYALVYLGEIESERGLTDGVIVEVGERGSERAYIIVQPFAIEENDGEPSLELLSDAFVLNEIKNVLV